ncbi:SLBB domain-containing protein [Shewanella sp. A3A]|nr:SLBB domain-containing protein [Shewanella ferrihydritica]
MSGLMKKIILIWFVCLGFATAPTFAASVSPQMIQQFKNLPQSEQQRLAKQYGIDPSQFGVQQGQSSSHGLDNPELVSPRNDDAYAQRPDKKDQVDFLQNDAGKLKRFGYEMFAGVPSTFAPTSDTPVPADYFVGPGDTIKVQLFGKESSQYDLTIARDGVLQFPELGPINAVGLTFSALRETIIEKVSQQMIGVQANVTMGELRSIRIFVAGDAYKPGSYTVSSLATITQALFVSGGVSDIGSLRDIQLKRQGKVISHFDLYDLLLNGDSSNDLPLRSGDVVFIPAVGPSISVNGEVQRPAIYELKPNETLADVVKMAAGLKAGAYPKSSTVERFNVNGLKSVISVDLTDSSGKQFVAKDGDYLRVKNSSKDYDNAITLIGAVVRPGVYQYQAKQTISSLLPSLGSDLLRDADLNYGLVIREVDALGNIEVLQFSPANGISHPNTIADLALAPRDKVVIFNANNDARNRFELNQLVNKRIEKIQQITGANDNDNPLINGDLFTSGFAALDDDKQQSDNVAGVAVSNNQRLEELKKQQEQDAKAVSAEVEKMLMQLFEDKELIKLSNQLNREELLYPIINKLKHQSRSGQEAKVVVINGEVRFKGIYPLAENANVADLIAAAGGLSEGAYLKRAELSRIETTQDGSSLRHLSINLSQSLSDTRTAEKLEPRDVLTVMKIPEWQENQTVEVRGEVKFPGVYSIRRGETLEDVLQRAGGFTDNAYISASVFVRDSLKKQEELEIKKFADQLRREIATKGLSSENSTINYADAQQMLLDLQNTKAVGRLVIDLPAISLGIAEADLQLENKDLLYVPPKKQTISVTGEVQHPSSHRFKKGLSVEQYIELAGNPKKRADEDRIYVIKANGAVELPDNSFWSGSDEQLAPGDTIVVPLDTEYKDNLTLWSQVTGIIYNSAVALAALGNI